MPNTIIFIMGVSSSGKSTIGEKLAKKMDLPFFDGDDFHSSGNISKMEAGHALNDHDRKSWLEAINQLAIIENKKKGGIIACSALKQKYRNILSQNLGDNFYFVFLSGSLDTINKRMKERHNHFMPSTLLQSQFDDLELPSDALEININLSPDEICKTILEQHLTLAFKKA